MNTGEQMTDFSVWNRSAVVVPAAVLLFTYSEFQLMRNKTHQRGCTSRFYIHSRKGNNGYLMSSIVGKTTARNNVDTVHQRRRVMPGRQSLAKHLRKAPYAAVSREIEDMEIACFAG